MRARLQALIRRARQLSQTGQPEVAQKWPDLNEAATAAYGDAHDAQLARAPATHHPTGPADGDNLAVRFRGDLHDPWAPDTWIDAPAQP